MYYEQLREIQSRCGYLPKAELAVLAERLGVPLHHLDGIASFYPQLHTQPVSSVRVQVCRDMSCHLKGSAELCKSLQARFGGTSQPPSGEGGAGAVVPSDVSVDGVSCLGRCDRAPAVMINDHLYVGRTEASLFNAIGSWQERKGRGEPDHQVAEQLSQLEKSDGQPNDDLTRDECSWAVSNSWQINHIYRDTDRNDHYQVLKGFVRQLRAAEDRARETLQSELSAAGLLGMGGAGGRVFKKWNEVLNARRRDPQKGLTAYVVCNADESEPGTFKDRELLLRTPYLIVEAMVIAGLYVGAKQGYLYLRHEYHEQERAIRAEIDYLKQNNMCGEDILGCGRDFDLEVFVSPGGYICGEQTALIEAIEGHRAEPRNRPPALQENGLFNMPTLVNNVESFAWIPAILHTVFVHTTANSEKKGTAETAAADRDKVPTPDSAGATAGRESEKQPAENWYRRQKKNGYSGLRFFSISGDVVAPGVFEVPNGITLNELMQLAGGPTDGFKAVALSGPSGGFLPARLPRTFFTEMIERLEAQWETFQQGLERHRVLLEQAGASPATIAEWDHVAKRGSDDLSVETRRRLDRDIKVIKQVLDQLAPDENPWCDVRQLILDKAQTRTANVMLGAGIVVYGQQRDMLLEALNCQRFFRQESCGKCVPCREGNQSLVMITENLAEARTIDSSGASSTFRAEELKTLIDTLNETMRETSICGLGQVASNPLWSALSFFPNDLGVGCS